MDNNYLAQRHPLVAQVSESVHCLGKRTSQEQLKLESSSSRQRSIATAIAAVSCHCSRSHVLVEADQSERREASSKQGTAGPMERETTERERESRRRTGETAIRTKRPSRHTGPSVSQLPSCRSGRRLSLSLRALVHSRPSTYSLRLLSLFLSNWRQSSQQAIVVVGIAIYCSSFYRKAALSRPPLRHISSLFEKKQT